MQDSSLDYEKFQKVFAVYQHLYPSQSWTDMVVAKYFESFVRIGTTLAELEAMVDFFFWNKQEFKPHPSDLIEWIRQYRSPDGAVDRTERDGDEVPVATEIPEDFRMKIEGLRKQFSATAAIERARQQRGDGDGQ